MAGENGPMSAFDWLDRISAGVALVAAQVAAAILFAVTCLILTEVVLRSFFATSTQIVEEYVAYGLGTMIFLALAHAMRSGVLVRVDILLGRLGPTSRRFFEIACCATTLIAMSFVVHYLSVRVGRDFTRGTISMTRAATPMWIPHLIVCTGMVIFMFQVVVYMIGLFLRRPLIRDQQPVE
jgi:TRAP-type C4-dicarboxylate transport system permease small subunit